MNYKIVLFFASTLLSCAFLHADGFEEPVSDQKIKKEFERQLGELKDAGKTVPAADLIKQLKKQESAKHALSTATDADFDTASVYERSKRGVLCFGNIYKCDHCDEWHGNIAGGFVISSDGLAVTNYHVVDNEKAGAFGAMTLDGKVYAVKEVIAASKRDDLAVVRLEGDEFHPLPVAMGDPVGSEVTVISHPQGRFYTVSKGIISRYFKARTSKGKGSDRLAITADYARGSSGSPVLNNDGAVIGVVAATSSIYYDKKDGVDRNLQMVIKSCIPSGTIHKILGSVKPEEAE